MLTKDTIQAGAEILTDEGPAYELVTPLKQKETTWTFMADRKGDSKRVVLDFFFLNAVKEKIDRKKLHKEAIKLTKMSHPNVVEGLAFHEQGDIVFYVTEYITSLSLIKTLQQNGRGDPLKFAKTMRELANALAYLEQEGIYHGNITPSSIVVPLEGQVKLSSFQLLRPGAWDDVGEDPPYHLSPEQIEGKKQDHRTDIFCLGATFFFLMTNQPPFKFMPVKERTKATIDPVVVNNEVNPYLGGIIMKMMTPKMKDRYQTASELAEDLDYTIGIIEGRVRPHL